jgi:hypothetical protein
VRPDLVHLVRLVQMVVQEDDERDRAERRAKSRRSDLAVGCAVCGEKNIPLIGHADTCSP